MTIQGGTRPSGSTAGGTLLPLCPLCESDVAEPVAVLGSFDRGPRPLLALRCGNCTGVYVNPPPTPEDLRPLPPPTSSRTLARWTGPPRPDATVSIVPPGRQRADDLDPGAYDLVVMPFSLETAPEPLRLLAEIREALRPSGRAVVAVRNLDSPTFRLFGGRHWSGYEFPHNRQLLNRHALALIGERAGLRLQDSTTVFSAEGWHRSMEGLLVDWGAPRWLTQLVVGRWGGAFLVSSIAEGLARLLGRGSVLMATLEKK